MCGASAGVVAWVSAARSFDVNDAAERKLLAPSDWQNRRLVRSDIDSPVSLLNSILLGRWRNRKITLNGFLDSGEETVVSESREDPEAPHLVLHRILHLGEAQLDSRSAKRVVEFDDGSGGCDVDAGNWLRRDNEPPDRRRRSRDRFENAVMKELRVGKKERRIPTEENEPRDQACLWIPRDIVISLHLIDAPEHGRVRAPPIPEKLNDGKHDRQENARNGAKDRDAGKTGD